jgi:hypothetical protein
MICEHLGIRLAAAGVTAVLASALAGAPGSASAAAHQAPVSRAAARAGKWLTAGALPSGRVNEALAYDPAHRELVMFGGNNASMVFGDTWINKDGRWTQEHPARSPSARTAAYMAYDTATRQLLLFGGTSTLSLQFFSQRYLGLDRHHLAAVAPGHVAFGPVHRRHGLRCRHPGADLVRRDQRCLP